MKKTKITGNFTGSIDQMMEHCANLDQKQVRKIVNSDKAQAILDIKKFTNNSDDDAAQALFDNIVQMEVKKALDEMIEDGLAQIVGYSPEGDAKYGLTDKGKQQIED